MTDDQPRVWPDCDRLILEIEVEGFNADGAIEYIEEEFPFNKDAAGEALLDLVTDEWMRGQVGLTLVTIPGEKCLNHDFEVVSKTCRIVGARIQKAVA